MLFEDNKKFCINDWNIVSMIYKHINDKKQIV